MQIKRNTRRPPRPMRVLTLRVSHRIHESLADMARREAVRRKRPVSVSMLAREALATMLGWPAGEGDDECS